MTIWRQIEETSIWYSAHLYVTNIGEISMAVGPVDSDHNATNVFLDGFQYSFYGFFYALKLVRNYSICTKT